MKFCKICQRQKSVKIDKTQPPTQLAVKPSEKTEESVSPQKSDNAHTGAYAAICAAAALILAAGTSFSRKKN